MLQFDVVPAYLNDKLKKEDIYMKNLKGLEVLSK